jgi:uncharacterized iron-regulated membrane protein
MEKPVRRLCLWAGQLTERTRIDARGITTMNKDSAEPRDALRHLGITKRLWLSIHLYVGLVAGGVFVVIGLSGGLLAFRVEIDEWLNKDLFAPTRYASDGERVSVDKIVAASRAVAPEGSTPFFVHFPKGAGGYFDVIYGAHGEGEHEDIHQIVVDPRDAHVIGQRLIIHHDNHFAEPFTLFLMHLHYTLLQGKAGATFVGFVGLFLFVSLATGLYLWLPRNGKLRQAFAIKRGASAERLTLDLHKTTGIYALGVLLVVIFSGVYLIFGSQVQTLVGVFSPAGAHHLAGGLKSSPSLGRSPIAPEAAVAAVDRLFPDGRLMSLALPHGEDGVYIVGKRSDDEVNRSEPKHLAAVDQYSGEILQIQNPRDYSAGETFLEWQFPLHTGEAFGDMGRAFIALMGLVPALLYATGVLRWLQKRRARRPHPERPRMAAGAKSAGHLGSPQA